MNLVVLPDAQVAFKEIDSCRGMANAVGTVFLDDGVTLYGAPNKVVVHFAKTDNGGADIFFCMATKGNRREVNEEKLEILYVAGASFTQMNTRPVAIAYMRDNPMKAIALDDPIYDSDADTIILTLKIDNKTPSIFDIAQIQLIPG